MKREVWRDFSRRVAGLLLTAPLLAFAPPTEAVIIGIDFFGSTVFAIDETAGTGATIGVAGFPGTNSMARNSAGTIYSVAGLIGAAGPLITINPATGAGTAGPIVTTPGLNGVRGLAFSATDVLFAAVDVGPAGSLGPDSLYTLDVPTGALTLVGATGLSGLQALAFSPSGTLYGWDAGIGGIGLVTINTATGVATDVNPTVGIGAADIQALDFAPDGTLFGAREALFTIDPPTGVTSLIGSGGYADVRGIAVIAAAAPEPGSLLLIGLALALGVAVSRATRRA